MAEWGRTVQDLAARFADGRLSTQKLNSSTDEELSEMLTAVRGIGQWTGTHNFSLTDLICLYSAIVNMFAMFSLRRPDVLPVGKRRIRGS
jgi:DNA-3-methyladenine glycosylase II